MYKKENDLQKKSEATTLIAPNNINKHKTLKKGHRYYFSLNKNFFFSYKNKNGYWFPNSCTII
jgi:hypothetical protein